MEIRDPLQIVRPMSAEQLKFFARSAETLAEQFEEEMARWVGDATVRPSAIGQKTIHEMADEDTDLTVIKAEEHLNHGVVVVDLHLALAIIATLCGGDPAQPVEVRPLSRLETGVLDLVLKPLVQCVGRLFDVGPVAIGIHATNPSGLPDSKPEPGVVVPLAVTVGNVEGNMNVGLTLNQVQAYVEEVNRRIAGRAASSTSQPNPMAVRAIQPVVVDVVVGFEPVRVPAGQLNSLQVGDVLSTGQSVSKSLVARVGDQKLFHVRPAQRGQRLVAELVSRIDNTFTE